MASGRCVGQRPDGHTFLCNFLTFSNDCILLTFGSIYTKLIWGFCKAWSALYDYVDQ